MKIIDIIKTTGKSLSFEFFPPKTEQGEHSLFETINRLSIYKPGYVSVTYGAGGSTRDKTIAVVERIKKETSLTVMPHLTCIGSTKQEISEIIGYYKDIGIENILALRGDPPMGTTEYPEIEDGFEYASDLIEFLKSMKAFSIGAAVYPEGHRESPSIEMDMVYTKKKVDAGADFFITQMFFENRFFYEFLQRAEKYDINVPIIPGIMIITDFKRIRQLSNMCGTSIPKKLGDLIDKYTESSNESRTAGIDYTTEQCRDLLENGIKYFHFYTLNHWEPASMIINNLFSNF